MKREAILIAFSTQKGGVGKTTFTTLAASYLHYVRGYEIMVVDCDYPQYSINAMRKRDAAALETDSYLQELAVAQFSKIRKPTYTIVCSSPEEAPDVVSDFLKESAVEYDIVFFDLPGTVSNAGVINTLSRMDYIFTPISADRIALESSLSFASAIQEAIVGHQGTNTKGIYLFWNMVDGREKTNLYKIYEKIIGELKIPVLKTFVPNTTRYKKELSEEHTAVFRSTIFPADKRLIRGSNLVELLDEILQTINIENDGRER